MNEILWDLGLIRILNDHGQTKFSHNYFWKPASVSILHGSGILVQCKVSQINRFYIIVIMIIAIWDKTIAGYQQAVIFISTEAPN